MTVEAPITVLHLRDSPWVDGPGRTILESATHFDSARVTYHIGVFVGDGTDRHPLLEAARKRGANAHPIADPGGFSPGVLQGIARLVSGLGVDVLHTSELRSNLYGWLCRRRFPQLRIVTTTHGWIANTWRRRLSRIADKMLLRQFDAVVMVSSPMRALVPKWWLPDAKVAIIHNALVLDAYGREHSGVIRHATVPTERAVFLNVGRLSPEKGQSLLLHAFSDVASAYPRSQLWFAGTGPIEQQLRALSGSLGLAERVRFLGYVDDMPALYSEVDVVVQSSLTEGMPNVILESAYLRVPIIATAVGGTTEIVDHDVNGWLVRPGSRADLAGAMRALLEDPGRFAAMAAKGRDRVAARFSFDARTEKITELYEDLCRRQR